MSEPDDIDIVGGTTSGEPRLAGMHLSIEPFPGWSLGFNRLMQYGGGARDDDLLGDPFDAWFRPSKYDNTGSAADFGNQRASITSSFSVPTELPRISSTRRGHVPHERLAARQRCAVGGRPFPADRPEPGPDVRGQRMAERRVCAPHLNCGLTNEGNVLGHWGGTGVSRATVSADVA